MAKKRYYLKNQAHFDRFIFFVHDIDSWFLLNVAFRNGKIILLFILFINLMHLIQGVFFKYLFIEN